jgi:octaprenyl-diphosphate synthase
MNSQMDNPVKVLRSDFEMEMRSVDRIINRYMTSDSTPIISELSSHLIKAGGKRLRPLLTIASAKMCDYSGDAHIKLAAAIEFIHSATLLHDDVVDESEKRRGKPTANFLWNNQSSVLVGDYLFSKSFQLMVEVESLNVLSILADASATISEGEILQLSAVRNLNTSQEVYYKIIEGKTAALFSAATKVGAVIANTEKDFVTALMNYGQFLGLCFQLTDDLLDYIGDEESLGKKIGDDFKEGKLTLPLIKAIEKSTSKEQEFWKKAIQKNSPRDDKLEQALFIMKKYETLDFTRNEAINYSKKASNSLDVFPRSDLKDTLKELASHVVSRIN